jgi:uncharacterized membrane protein
MKLPMMLSTAILAGSLTLSGAALANDTAADAGKAPHHRFEEAISKLPAAKQKLVHDAMEKSKAENKELWTKGRQLREEQKSILTAEKFDKGAYLAKSKEIEDLHDKMAQNRSEAFASIAGQLTPEERVSLAKMHRGGPRHHKDEAEHPQAAQ